MLKLAFRGRENEHEAAALSALVGGRRRCPSRLRLRVQRAAARAGRAGTPLASEPAEAALEVYADLLPRLWQPAGPPFRTLVDEAAWWAGDIGRDWESAGRPIERELLDVALEALHELPATQGELVLVHQDLHAGNVLRARRQPWLAIDPKPILAEREFSLAPIVRAHGARP